MSVTVVRSTRLTAGNVREAALGTTDRRGGARESTSPQASILIVDDDPGNRKALQELLRSGGWNPVAADSGEEALRQASRRDFAVILMDARMPGMDGFETAKLIRERERSRHTPVIFLTGACEDLQSIFRGYEAGAVDYIVKPLVPEVLKSKISVLVDLYNKNAELTREVAERRRAELQLRASEENLRALAAHLQSVREEERTRISREIHDELGQVLTGLKMDLEWVAKRLPANEKTLDEKTKSMLGQIDASIESVRRIAARLRPDVLDQLGFAAAIEWQAKEFQKRTGVRCTLSLPSDTPALDRERSTALFRVFQELLTNVARHANATRIQVAMRTEAGLLVLLVEDNGKGIDEAVVSSTTSLGFLGMRERIVPFGGAIEVGGGRGKGTAVKVSVPLAVG